MTNAVVRWWRGLGHRNDIQQAGRYCSAGHPMDPNWETCPRCAAEQRAREKTVLDTQGAAAGQPSGSTSMSDSKIRRPTAVDDNGTPAVQEPVGGARSARPPPATQSPPPASMQPAARWHERKIAGILVTFSWSPQGQLFVLYEGRNVIGSGRVESEDGRECDVMIEGDDMLSGEHAVILCRHGRYELVDRHSTNGTYMNDVFVEIPGVQLADGARITTGATVWTFRKIDGAAPAQAASGQPVPQPARPPDTQHDPG